MNYESFLLVSSSVVHWLHWLTWVKRSISYDKSWNGCINKALSREKERRYTVAHLKCNCVNNSSSDAPLFMRSILYSRWIGCPGPYIIWLHLSFFWLFLSRLLWWYRISTISTVGQSNEGKWGNETWSKGVGCLRHFERGAAHAHLEVNQEDICQDLSFYCITPIMACLSTSWAFFCPDGEFCAFPSRYDFNIR